MSVRTVPELCHTLSRPTPNPSIDYDLKIADEELGFTIHRLTLR